jgi:hypothetical protein
MQVAASILEKSQLTRIGHTRLRGVTPQFVLKALSITSAFLGDCYSLVNSQFSLASKNPSVTLSELPVSATFSDLQEVGVFRIWCEVCFKNELLSPACSSSALREARR